MTARTVITPTITRSNGRLQPRDNLIRAATAAIVARVRHGYPADVARKMWPEDRVTPHLLTRAAVAPASLGDEAWAGAIAATSISDYLGGLAAQSIAARLLASGLQLDLANRGMVSIPRLTAPVAPAWVGEGGAIPVAQLTLAADPLGPKKKLAVMAAFTIEMAKAAGIEALVRTVLTEATMDALDGAVLSSVAATDSNPAGIFHGTAPLTPTAGGGTEAMLGDLKKLIEALIAVGAGRNIAFVGHPSQVAAIRLRSGANFTYPVFATPAFTVGTIAAVELGALASAVSPAPLIDVSEGALIHLSDTPAQISTVGAPNQISAPARSAFQSGSLALRVILDVDFVMRAPGMAQHITETSW